MKTLLIVLALLLTPLAFTQDAQQGQIQFWITGTQMPNGVYLVESVYNINNITEQEVYEITYQYMNARMKEIQKIKLRNNELKKI